ncbi:hypothetical protein B0H63DRAFT_389263 [Podospora didyma]|uniref:Uncharacterized protein n=1 Tax=Podospora didyma TaxID=330526 RepID=A0AAE0NYL5_9PEZI|nr:hypothetical protein B0H63DRAFT_389263 [Podospora didyma]
MLSIKRDTVDSFSSLGDDWSRRGSVQSNPVLVLPFRFDPRSSDLNTTALSPPPVSGTPKPQPKNVHLRLRSDSGFSLHTNQSAFRQYTDYNSDGSTRSVTRPERRPLSFEGTGNVDSISVGSRNSSHLREPPPLNRSVPNFFDQEVIKLAFCNPTTGQRLSQFAQSRPCAADVEFLLKVEEYNRVFGSMTTLISHITTNFTGVAATSPINLPADLSTGLKANTKNCARSVLPPLETLYQGAKISVEERLAKTLYPDFVKYQLSQCMKSSLSVSRTLTGGFKSAYPGLGHAFCLTDPLEPDNPMIYVSDSLLKVSGYQRHEMLQKNCRILQGISTDSDATQHIREAVRMGRETTELILNYRKDGSAFWNLLFICPLLEHGIVRYHLGAQINVSENMGADYKDILRILNFTLPGEEAGSSSTINAQDRSIWRGPVIQDRTPPDMAVPGMRSPRPRSHRLRFFRRFSKKSGGRNKAQSRPSTPSTTTSSSAPEDLPTVKRRAYTTRSPQLERRPTDEFNTPYARFFVMRYEPTLSQHCHGGDKRNNVAGRMSVSFCSSFALELLGLKDGESDAVLGHDIFTVLADYINSPNVNKTLRTSVVDKMAAGEATSADLLASAEHSIRQPPAKHPRTGNVIRGPGATSALESESMGRPRLSDTLDRGAGILSHVFFGPRMRKLVSHWTPLKDGDGQVGWVVLVLTPTNVAL